MKKINIALIVLTIALSLVTVFSELDKGIVVVLKDLSIILTLFLPYILNKIFKLKINEKLIFIWIIFTSFYHLLLYYKKKFD